MEINKNIKWTANGQKLNIEVTIPYSDFKCIELPEHCGICPVAYSCSGKCGRNVPFLPEDNKRRPDSCKLKLIDINEIINNILEN